MSETADALAPRVAESVPVVLARMEGTLLRISDRVGDLTPRVERVEDRAKALEDITLTLTKNAEAKEARDVALALALEKADETRRKQSEQSWSPFQRLIGLLGGLGVAVSLVIQFYSTIHH